MNNALELARGNRVMKVISNDILHQDQVCLTAMTIIEHPDAIIINGKLISFSICIYYCCQSSYIVIYL